MRRIGIAVLFAALLLLNVFAVSAMSASDARQEWRDAKETSLDLQEQHRQAKLDFAGDKSEENRQAVVDTGKDVLNAALDEVEAWLTWKELEAEENDDVPPEILDAIKDDVAANKDKIDDLRVDVDSVENQLQLAGVWLKMIGKYFELLTDVARNSGEMWVYIANERADRIADYAQQLRITAEETDNHEALVELDAALDELEIARRNIDNADDMYGQVRLPGTPLIKFSEGNNYLRAAQANLITAHRHLDMAYRELVR